eukprot:6478709-Amphidinium_carterae.1
MTHFGDRVLHNSAAACARTRDTKDTCRGRERPQEPAARLLSARLPVQHVPREVKGTAMHTRQCAEGNRLVPRHRPS